MSDFWIRVKRSHLVQALVVYLAGAWVALQVLALFTSAFDWPKWVVQGAIIVLAAGLVATIVLVWERSSRRRVSVAGEPDRRRWIGVGAIALALFLVGGALWLTLRRSVLGPSPAAAEAAGPGVAVLPFTVNDPSLDRWREGMVDLLSTNLDGAAGLRAIDSRTVLAHWNRVGDDAVDLATALDVGRAAGGRFGIVGSVVASGTGIRIGTEVYDLETDRPLGRDMVEGSPDSIFQLVDRLSIRLLDRLLEEEGGLPAVDLAAVTTASVPALKSYLDGEAAFRRSDFTPAIEAYRSAVAADSTFALAWFRLGEAIGWIETVHAEGPEAALRIARRYSDRLPPRDRELLAVSLAYHEDDPDATELARAAVERYPDDPTAWYLLGEVRFHMPHQTLPTRLEQEEPFVRASRLDPSFTPAYIHLLDIAFAHGDSARARRLLAEYDRQGARAAEYTAWYHAAFDLAFGDAGVRAAVLAAVDTVPTSGLRRIAPRLFHPAALDVQGMVVERVTARPDAAPEDSRLRLNSLLMRGRLEAVAGILDSPGFPAEARKEFLTFAYVIGVPFDSVRYARALAVGPADTVPGPGTFGVAIYALEHGNEAAIAPLRSRVEQQIDGLLAAGDTLQAIDMEASLAAYDGRKAMLEGRPEAALDLLEPAFHRTGIEPAHGWIIQLHAEAGRYGEAIRYGEIIGPNPWIGLPMGQLYEEIEQPRKAMDAYGWVVEGWTQADPVLQPQVEEARRAIERLAGLDRG